MRFVVEDQLYNTDSTLGMALLPAESVDLVVTDPPYEVKYNEKSAELEKLGKSREKQIERDKSFVDVILDYDAFARELYRVLKPNTHAYLFCGDRQITKWTHSMTLAGFKHPQILVWKKNRTTFDMTFGYKYPENKEFILFFHKGWRRLNGYKVERHDFRSVLCYDSSKDTDMHSCAKPINLLMFLIKASSNEGDVVLDPFMGSGNHIIAAKRINRHFIGYELSTPYFDAIIKRLSLERTQTTLETIE